MTLYKLIQESLCQVFIHISPRFFEVGATTKALGTFGLTYSDLKGTFEDDFEALLPWNVKPVLEERRKQRDAALRSAGLT